jgi:hypothetical protein
MPVKWTLKTGVDLIDTKLGERLDVAGDKINAFFHTLSADLWSFLAPLADARAQQVITVPFSEADSTVVDYLTSNALNPSEMDNMIVEKYWDLPGGIQTEIMRWFYDPRWISQKAGLLSTTRAVVQHLGVWQFANNKLIYSKGGGNDFTGIIGNIYSHPLTGSFEVVINGIFYDYTDVPLTVGTTYFLTDSMDGWLIPYEEGGTIYPDSSHTLHPSQPNQRPVVADSVSLPMAVAIHPNAAVLLTERSITKELPCRPMCPPQRLRFQGDLIYNEYLDITDGDPWSDPDVIKYSEYTTYGEPTNPLADPWTNPSVRKYTQYEEIP